MIPDETTKREKKLLGLYPEIDSSFLNWLRVNGFFTAPASTKYHGNYEGGLFDHSYLVAIQLRNLTKANKLVWANKRSPIVVGLFHDICKTDQYRHPDNAFYDEEQFCWEYRDDMLLKGHGDKSVMILASQMQLTEEEVICIRYHMGAFTDKAEWNDYTRAVHRHPNVLWTHHADMFASHVMGV